MRFYTLTPNPALDLSGHARDLVPDEKNYVHDERRDPGGNGINSARVAGRLGTNVLALGFLGGSTGDEVASLLRREGVPSAFTPIQGHTRINVSVTNDKTHRQTRLTFPGPPIRPPEVRALLARLRGLRAPGILALGGSAPPGMPAGFHSMAGRAASSRGLGVIVDVPARFIDGIRGFEPLLIKPNQAELEEWAGRKLRSDHAIVEAARKLARRATLVCVSLAERGAILVTREGAWFGAAPRVRARGTVGAGDSMVGAMAAELMKARLTRPEQVREAFRRSAGALPPGLERALIWGLAAGAATAEVAGTALAGPREIRRLAGKGRIRRLF